MIRVSREYLWVLCREERSSEVTHTSVLVCPCCESEYKPQGAKQPMSLRCGHTFCSGSSLTYEYTATHTHIRAHCN